MRQKYRKYGLKKMEKDMKNRKYTEKGKSNGTR